MNKIISRLLSTSSFPVIPVMTNPGIELINKRVIDAVSDGEVHFQAIMALRERFPQLIASTTIMDLSLEAEAFGANILFEPNEVPTVSGRLFDSNNDIRNLIIPSIDSGRIPEYLKANMLASTALDIPLFGGCIGPFTLASRLYDMTEIMMAMFIDPETIKELLEKCTEFILSYCREIKRCGSAGVVFAEPAAGLLSNDDCQTFSSNYISKIVNEIQDDDFVIILHNCGNNGQCTDAMISTGAAALHFGNSIDMEKVLDKVPVNIAVMGNIDPVGVVKMGTPEYVREMVESLRKIAKGHSNFILSTGCDVPPNVPFENIEAFFSAIQ